MATAPDSPEVRRLARDQAGLVTRAQLTALDLTPAQARAAVRAGCWRRLAPGLYLTHLGEITPLIRVWAGVLGTGEGAIAGPVATLWLQGVVEELPRNVDVWIPHERRVGPRPGTRIHRRRELAADTRPSARPPQLRLERAVIEVARRATRTETAVDVLVAAVQRRRTTAERLLAELDRDRAHRRRRLITDVLSDVEEGVRSQLERRWVHHVERPHGLPPGTLNAADHDGVTRRYRDVAYLEWGVVTELDGRESHPDHERFRDRARDNRVAADGRITLRYGWREVAGDPCAVAAEVATTLRRRGWPGTPTPCSPTCPIAADQSWGGSGEL